MTDGNGWSGFGFVGWAGAKVFGYLYVRDLMGSCYECGILRSLAGLSVTLQLHVHFQAWFSAVLEIRPRKSDHVVLLTCTRELLESVGAFVSRNRTPVTNTYVDMLDAYMAGSRTT